MPLRRQSEFVEVDEARAKRIAKAYEEMKHDPNDPKVKEAYAVLIRQTTDQYRALEAAGYEFYFFDEASADGNPWNAMLELRANKRMGVFATVDGIGSDDALNLALQNNFLLPQANLFYIRPALDYLFLNSIREAISPGYMRRRDRRRLKDYGQERAVESLRPFQ